MTDLLSSLDDLAKLSPTVILILFLNIVGFSLKKSPLDNRYIPIVLMVLGSIAYNFIGLEALKPGTRYPHVTLTMLGAIIGFASVGLNQAYRQFKPLRFLYEDTSTPTAEPPSTPNSK